MLDGLDWIGLDWIAHSVGLVVVMFLLLLFKELILLHLIFDSRVLKGAVIAFLMQ